MKPDHRIARNVSHIFAEIYNKYIYKNGYCGKFLSREESLEYLITTKKSYVRYGDGESLIMMGGSIYFQEFSYGLHSRLWEIVKKYSENSPYLFGIDHWAIEKSSEELMSMAKGPFSYYETMRYPRYLYFRYYNKKQVYLDATLFKGKSREWLRHLIASIEKYRKIIVVKSNADVVKSFWEKCCIDVDFEFVEIPSENAFRVYDEIYDEVRGKIDKLERYYCAKDDILILLSAGPCAKILAYDLSKDGKISWDIGKMFECWLE